MSLTLSVSPAESLTDQQTIKQELNVEMSAQRKGSRIAQRKGSRIAQRKGSRIAQRKGSRI